MPRSQFAYLPKRQIVLPPGQSVFVVDDDLSMRTSMNRLLRGHGFDATLFDSAGALLEHGRFDNAICIVLDINLGGTSGIDVRRKLAEQGVTAPVIYITGNDSPANRAAALASGCIAYLIKPFMAQSLIESVERAGIS
ncbi:response regulator transcription factor [Bradyrhizobium sp. CCGB20]|uniref:response regulator transcription factor n=1 Tax=Bradyrhizobium sp. CCGB20 TaxID=2949633 RepID=UPI0021150993|nr:response regulator [Bradyrhizobium sp. CCGB20]